MSNSLLDLIPRMRMVNLDAIVGWCNETPLTRREFLERVSGWQTLLVDLPGQNYALYLEDGLEFSAALFGAWYAGKTVWLAADTLASTTEALKARVDGFLGGFPKDYQPLQARLPNPPPQLAEGINHVCYSDLDDQFLGVVVYTSGTSGTAQAIPKKLTQLTTEVATLEKLFGAKIAHAEIVSTVSHQHIYGLLFKILWPLTTGRPIHAQTQLFPEQLAQLISTRSCILISSPAHLKRLPTHLNWGNHQGLNKEMALSVPKASAPSSPQGFSGDPASLLSNKKRHWVPANPRGNDGVCAIFSSGGGLNNAVAQSTLALLGQRPIEIFGSSETGGIAWRQSEEAWTAMPNVEWRISEGLLEVRSPHLLSEEWFSLSDQAEAQDNDRFILRGRCDRIVKIEEKRISLDLVEQRIATSSFVSEVKVIAFNEETQRQYLAAVIVLSEAGKALFQNEGKLAVNRQLKALLINFVESVAWPRRWRYVEQLPLNAQGKTPLTLLRALFSTTKEPHVQLLQHDEHRVELAVNWPADLYYFQGHFPGTPILPGVVQVDWALKTARQFFSLPTQFCAMHTLKFQHVILPDTSVNLTLQYDPHKACLNFSYSSAGKQHASGRLLFTSESSC